MPKTSDPLTPDDLQTLNERRAAARERAKAQLDGPIDVDNPPLSDAQLAKLRPAHEVRPELVAAQLKRERGRPPATARKELISLRLDPDITERLRSTGEGWQSRINGLLREALGLAPTAQKAPSLDGRHRDKRGEISRKHGNTQIGTLRKHYGVGFAPGFKDTDTLAHVLATLDEPSLSKLIVGRPRAASRGGTAKFGKSAK
jgi:uncharacterized protein (DUF4415 family)